MRWVRGVDRVQVAGARAGEIADRWIDLLGARLVGEDHVQSLNARRLTLKVGNGHVEVLEPLGSGPVAAHLESGRGGPFAAGLAVAGLERAATRLRDLGVDFRRDEGQLYLDEQQLDIPGLRLVLSEAGRSEETGRLQTIYEVTLLTPDPGRASARLAELFELDSAHFVPIESELYGYRGTLTLFDPDRLDRLEIVDPFDRAKTMGRYFSRFGPSLYMCFAECGDTQELRDVLMARAPGDWTGPAEGAVDSLFVHPKALGGVMLGVSRTTFAWSWSGSPERVRPERVRPERVRP